MSKRIPLLAALGISAVLSPAFAAEVFIPIATQQTADGLVYRTEVVVSNPGEETRTFSSTLLTAESDRAVSPVSMPRRLPAGGTFVLRQPMAAGRSGLLAISGLESLVVTARVEALRGGTVVSTSPAPVVTGANLLPAGATAHLQGIGKSAVLGLVNTSADAAQCWATVIRADGTPAGETEITAAPRSARLWNEALAALGSSLAEARAEVTCDAPFYAYALVNGPTGALSVLSPSGSLDPEQDELDTLDAGTAEARASLTCPAGNSALRPLPGGGEGFYIAGEFLNVRANDLCRAYDLPLATGVAYRHLTVEFDVRLNKWVSPLFHNVAGLRRSAGTRNERILFAGLMIRGDNKKTILDLGQEAMVREAADWRRGNSYHVILDADVPTRQITLKVLQGTRVVQQLTGRMTAREIRSLADKKVKVDFSSPGVGDGAYFPPTGWRYSNLVVRAQR